MKAGTRCTGLRFHGFFIYIFGFSSLLPQALTKLPFLTPEGDWHTLLRHMTALFRRLVRWEFNFLFSMPAGTDRLSRRPANKRAYPSIYNLFYNIDVKGGRKMCEANAYLVNGEKEELVMEMVDRVIPGKEEIYLEDIMGHQMIIKGKIKELVLVDHKVLIEKH